MHAGEGCASEPLAYWVTSQTYSEMDLEWSRAKIRHTTGIAFVNGTKVRVLFDTGASESVLSPEAAQRAGIKTGDAGVKPGGPMSGLGRRRVETWIVPVSSFKIGDEEIRNSHLRIGDVGLADADMAIGVDFFLSHRIYVAKSQSKLYFTYNGGPVFNLNRTQTTRAAVDASTTETTQSANEEEPVDAESFSRRGAARAARRDFEGAIADLTRACELDPRVAKYFFQRGLARWNSGHPAQANVDFDQAILLEPGDADALLARAKLNLVLGNNNEAASDLASADRVTPREANMRFEIATTYVQANLLEQAVAQYDQWIAVHPQDSKLADAFNRRCWALALSGKQLERALEDCETAIKLSHDSADYLDSRGLVRLRLGQYKESIADYDDRRGPLVEYWKAQNGQQSGDPAKLARAHYDCERETTAAPLHRGCRCSCHRRTKNRRPKGADRGAPRTLDVTRFRMKPGRDKTDSDGLVLLCSGLRRVNQSSSCGHRPVRVCASQIS